MLLVKQQAWMNFTPQVVISYGQTDMPTALFCVYLTESWLTGYGFGNCLIQELHSFLQVSRTIPLPLIGSTPSAKVRRSPFKFFNFQLTDPQFVSILDATQNHEKQGVSMFCLYSKLKSLKFTLKIVNHISYSNISDRVKAAHTELMQIQGEQ